MIRKPPPERESRAVAAVRTIGEAGAAAKRLAQVARWRFVGIVCYIYTVFFAIATLGTLASSGIGPAMIAGAVTAAIYYGGGRAMAKARQLRADG